MGNYWLGIGSQFGFAAMQLSVEPRQIAGWLDRLAGPLWLLGRRLAQPSINQVPDGAYKEEKGERVENRELRVESLPKLG